MPGLAVSNELEYLLTRTTSSYIVKQASLPRYFSREPRNLAQIHSFKFSGTTNAKTIGIEPVSGGGVAVVTRKSKASPSALKGAYTATTIKKGGSRRVAGVVSNLTKNGYRRDLTQLAVARSSAILRAQRSRKARPTTVKPRGNKAIAAANAKANAAPAEESAAEEAA